MSIRFRVNNPHVISEMIQGEVIVIHLETGSYYSLRDVGAEIWNAIEQGTTVGEIAHRLSLRYDAAPERIESDVSRLLDELAKEELVVSESAVGNVARSVPDEAPDHATREPFVAPTLEKHTDMQDLLLLDPVHEVDGRGWPHAAPSSVERA